MQKNTANQKWVVYAYDRTNDTPKTGDAANITANVRIDGGGANAVDDTNPTELEGGYYVFDITDAESNGSCIVICPASVTANIQVIGCPRALYTTSPNVTTLSSDIAAVQTVANAIKSDLTVTDAVADKISSDLIVTDAVADTIKSDLIVADAMADKISSDLVVADANVDKVVSDMTVADANIDKILSDLTVVAADVNTVASDVVAGETDITVIISDIAAVPTAVWSASLPGTIAAGKAGSVLLNPVLSATPAAITGTTVKLDTIMGASS